MAHRQPIKYTDASGADVPMPVSLTDATVAIPTDLQSQYRPLLASSTTGLAASAEYSTGNTGIDISNYTHVLIVCFSNHAGTISVETGGDTNFDSRDSIAYAANSQARIAAIPVSGHLLRVRFTKDATVGTSTFRFYIYGRVM